MTKENHKRVCVDPSAISTLRRDGLGWGHDLECGCFDVAGLPARRGLWGRLADRIKTGSN